MRRKEMIDETRDTQHGTGRGQEEASLLRLKRKGAEGGRQRNSWAGGWKVGRPGCTETGGSGQCSRGVL